LVHATALCASDLKRELDSLSEKPSKLEQHGAHTVRAYYGTLETSFISYEQVPAKPER
jgi:lipoate-protein ligase A